jgi:hypothetical protein
MMIASLLRINGPINDDLFKRFIDTTSGVVAAYQLETPDDPNGGAVFTVWQDEAARDAYMSSHPLKGEVDQAYPNQARSVFHVRSSKS